MVSPQCLVVVDCVDVGGGRAAQRWQVGKKKSVGATCDETRAEVLNAPAALWPQTRTPCAVRCGAVGVLPAPKPLTHATSTPSLVANSVITKASAFCPILSGMSCCDIFLYMDEYQVLRVQSQGNVGP